MPDRKKRCPFCGGGVMLCTVWFMGEPRLYFMVCPDCRVSGPRMKTKEGAARAWKNYHNEKKGLTHEQER